MQIRLLLDSAFWPCFAAALVAMAVGEGLAVIGANHQQGPGSVERRASSHFKGKRPALAKKIMGRQNTLIG